VCAPFRIHASAAALTPLHTSAAVARDRKGPGALQASATKATAANS